jgi:hypothetical protein
MNITRALALVVLVFALFSAACGTGNRLDTWGDGPGGGQYIAVIGQFDSGSWTLADGVLDPRDADDNAADLYVPNQDLVPSFHIQNATQFHTADPTYDTNGDGVPDFIVITMRALSAQAAANVEAYTTEGGAAVDPGVFIKVGGCAIEPLDAVLTESGNSVSRPAEIWLPIYTGTDGNLSVYKWVDETLIGRSTSDDIGTGTGHWVLYTTTLEQPDGSYAVKFNVDSFGQYAVVSDSVLHNQGTGGSV